MQGPAHVLLPQQSSDGLTPLVDLPVESFSRATGLACIGNFIVCSCLTLGEKARAACEPVYLLWFRDVALAVVWINLL
jgi:hypothetical protein